MSKKVFVSEHAKEVEDFYGVYLLYCTNPKYKGRTYIGFTVDPNRRISQHNRGKHAGGAGRTSNKGPWEMVLIIHGFPNEISALRFEWAWQHPSKSRRLNHLPKKKAREKTFDFCLRLVASMLNLGPWNRLPLTVRWLKPEYQRDFPADLQPPLHMPLVFGPVKSKKVQKKDKSKVAEGEAESEDDELLCCVCFKIVASSDRLQCLSPKCGSVGHTICLSDRFLSGTSNVIPVRGNCPTCGLETLWGDLIRKSKGCYEHLVETEEQEQQEEESS